MACTCGRARFRTTKSSSIVDADGDGRADKSTVFADGLNIPAGMETGDGGVYVGQGEELLFLRDFDDDGQADERRVVLSDFGTGDPHQAINSFVWSPDGELLFSARVTASSHAWKRRGVSRRCTGRCTTPESLAKVQTERLVKLRDVLGTRLAVQFAGPFIMSFQGAE